MIIDMHMHPFCREATVKPGLEEALERMLSADVTGLRAQKLKPGLEFLFSQNSVQDIIKKMDEAGVNKACIVAMDMSTRYGVELVTNEDVSRLAGQYPDRFIPFASVDPSMGRLAVDKLVYAVKELGCRGVKLVPPVQHFDFSDPRHDPLWQTVQDLDIILWTHCAHQYSHPDSDARLGQPMLLEPVAHKFRRLKIVLGHCGFPWVWEAWSMAVRHPNVYVDVSVYHALYQYFPWQAYSTERIEEKLLFATDFPLQDIKGTLEALEAVDISSEFKQKIRGDNAARLLGLK